MKISDITETLRSSSLEKTAAEQLKTLDMSGYIHIGDMEHFDVMRNDIGFVLLDTKDKTRAGLFVVKSSDELPEYMDIILAYVDPKYRGRKIFEGFLWFIKSRLNYNIIQFGNSHTDDMIKTLKVLSKGPFNLKWKNIKTGEEVLYDANTVDQYYGTKLKRTEWRVIAENQADFSDWPKYRYPLITMNTLFESMYGDED